MHPHSTHANHPPPLFSFARISSFLTSILVALASGTNYVFSAYGPQLGERLKLTHTQINIIGLSGNIGVYGTAPIWGGIVDRRGPRMLMVMAFFSLLIGYLGIRHFFLNGLPDGTTELGLLPFCLLVLCGFLTGIGGNGGLVGSMNATAKSFPDKTRATANGIVISGFGLSAFLFSTMAHTFFPGNTGSFLLVLAIGTALPMTLGFLFVRPIPPPHTDPTGRLEDGTPGSPADYGVGEGLGSNSPTTYSNDNNSHTHLLARDADEDEDELHEPAIELEEEEPLVSTHAQATSDYVVPGQVDSLALSPTRAGFARHRSVSARSLSRRSIKSNMDKTIDGQPNIHGKRLFKTADFWILFTICSLLSGTGIMYINNVGAISQALFADNNPDYDEVKAAQWQATQVSTVSVMNCLGRILIGIIADFTKGKLGLPRSFCIVLVAIMFVISQAMCYSVDSVGNLWKASALLGVSYGGLFGLFPTLVIEWFGLPHFSENWGFVSLSPMLGGNIFSIAFGRNVDAHDTGDDASPAATSAFSGIRTRAGLPSSHHCLQGRECYVDSIKMTIVACCIALVLGIYAGWRDLKRQRRRASRAEAVPTVVVWEDEE
ncbi:MFS general substrate transporter [Trametes coccinea BRFM310]|uniref:MFS general substrate transporter n=1 Tax=Trametes coccinea (strain BRFM310) TaxID=1353009 RepID=A0A1Y2ILE5_TRAC3|nr:MFS general substrate transporter [Trametes coccinea BRFM310]